MIQRFLQDFDLNVATGDIRVFKIRLVLSLEFHKEAVDGESRNPIDLDHGVKGQGHFGTLHVKPYWPDTDFICPIIQSVLKFETSLIGY